MKKVFYSIGGLLMASLLFSCQKEVSTLPTNTLSGTFVSKLIKIDTTISHPNDTIAIGQFTWDSQQRPKLAQYFHFQNRDTIATETYTLQYSGTDTFANKLIIIFKDFTSNEIFKDTTFIYCANGNTTADSTIRYNGLSQVQFLKRNYIYNGITLERIFETGNILSSPFPNTYIRNEYLHRTYIGANISTVTDTTKIQYMLQPTITNATSYNNTYTYTNTLNPFYIFFKAAKLVNTDYNEYPPLFILGCQPNLLLTAVKHVNQFRVGGSTMGNSNTHSNYTYLLNSNGYPDLIREVFVDDNSSTISYYKYLIFY